jgi:ribosomal protein L7/L12
VRECHTDAVTTTNDIYARLASGNKIAAIKAYRDEAGVDLPTATRTVDSL